jgi:hypothetical protein
LYHNQAAVSFQRIALRQTRRDTGKTDLKKDSENSKNGSWDGQNKTVAETGLACQ